MATDSTETPADSTDAPEVENVDESDANENDANATDSESEQSEATESTPDAAAEPEFAELDSGTQASSTHQTDLSRLNDVQVTVSAELGRTTVPIHEILKLGEGSVFELNRSIENPVELRAQDVAFGNGEVVVVDGNFAIRIQEIYKNDKKENDG